MVEIPINVQEYRKRKSMYTDFAKSMENVLNEILKAKKINFVFTQSRAKSIESFQGKLKNEDDKKELYDLTGIRVVGYVRSDVSKIVKIIKENFNIDEEKSKDKSEELDPDQFGYRAIHLIGLLPEQRIILPEYKKFIGMYFEIQIKTILEHAWAEIEHDRNYKYKGLPKDIQHDFYLTAGLLENADNQFESITERVEVFDKSIKQKTTEGKLEELELNPATFKRYCVERFGEEMELDPYYGDGSRSGDKEIKELSSVGIVNLKQLDESIPNKFSKIINEHRKMDSLSSKDNLSSIVFGLIMVVFRDKSREVLGETRKLNQVKFEEYCKAYDSAMKIVNEN